MGDKSKVCKSFDWPESFEIDWFDVEGIHIIDTNRRALIRLSEQGHSDHYVGFNVTILHKHNGEITQKFFLFDDYLKQEERIDARWANSALKDRFQIIGHVGWEWHMAVPTSTGDLTNAIVHYITRLL